MDCPEIQETTDFKIITPDYLQLTETEKNLLMSIRKRTFDIIKNHFQISDNKRKGLTVVFKVHENKINISVHLLNKG